MIGPTEKQQRCLNFIKEFTEVQKRSPTLRQIADHLQLKAHSSVWHMLRRMENRNLVKVHVGKANGVEVL
mgnify:CR=1 FL=1|tara:strand:- start:342 stop:551 length:210 start_codon:yes stop_codon:yes gene_type:complete